MLLQNLLEKNFSQEKKVKKNQKFLEDLFSQLKISRKVLNLQRKNTRVIRPGYGIAPKYYEKILFKKSPLNLKKEEPLNYRILDKLKIRYKP